MGRGRLDGRKTDHRHHRHRHQSNEQPTPTSKAVAQPATNNTAAMPPQQPITAKQPEALGGGTRVEKDFGERKGRPKMAWVM